MDGLRAKLRSHTSSIEGTVEDLVPKGDGAVALIDFQAWEEPSIRIAELVELEFSGGALGDSLIASSRVLMWGKDGVRYRGEFLLNRRERALLLSRRQAVRVRPNVDFPVTLVISPNSGEAISELVVNDISTKGLSVFIPRVEEALLASLWEIKLSLRLAHVAEPMDLLAYVRQRRLVGSTILYGIEFNPASQGFEQKRDLLLAYVLQRQHAILTERAKRRAG